MSNQMLEFTGTVMDVGQKSCLINVDGETGWVPDSLADYFDEPTRRGEITFLIPKWLAIKKGFIDE